VTPCIAPRRHCADGKADGTKHKWLTFKQLSRRTLCLAIGLLGSGAHVGHRVEGIPYA